MRDLSKFSNMHENMTLRSFSANDTATLGHYSNRGRTAALLPYSPLASENAEPVSVMRLRMSKTDGNCNLTYFRG